MKRRFISAISLMVALIGFSSSNLRAQNSPKQIATIPFDFIFEDTRLPAGSYEVQMIDSGQIVLLNTKKIGVEAEAATLPMPVRGDARKPELVFVNSSQGYTLVEVHLGQERRLITSEYGHATYTEAQLHRVAITSTSDQSGVMVREASAQGR